MKDFIGFCETFGFYFKCNKRYWNVLSNGYFIAVRFLKIFVFIDCRIDLVGVKVEIGRLLEDC